ncbi:MAG: HDOD domain-containing protein [Pseudomonadota bacterium]
MVMDDGAPYGERARALAAIDWPILEASAAVFDDSEDLVNRSLRELAQYAERDPGLSLRLIQQANVSRRGLRQEVHAAGDAIGMLGLKAISADVQMAPRVSDVAANPRDYRRLAAQSRLAALIAEEVARKRRDSEPGEVGLAALLNQLGFLALLVDGAPELSRLLEMLSLNALPDEASYVALGYATDDLSRAMAESMHLPELVTGTLRTANVVHPRAFEVMVASAVAWQIFRGMDTARGDRDLHLLAGLLEENDKAAADRLGEVITRFNADVTLYGIEPLDPGIPAGIWLRGKHRLTLALAPRNDLLEEGVAALADETDRTQRLQRMLRVLQLGVGLNRVVFARLLRDGETLRAEHLVGTLHEPEFSGFVISLAGLGPFAGVLEQDEPQWWRCDDLPQQMPEALLQLTGGVDCFWGRITEGDRVLGVVYADRRSPDLALTARDFSAFCRVLATVCGSAS